MPYYGSHNRHAADYAGRTADSTTEEHGSWLDGRPRRFVGDVIEPCPPTREGGCR